MALVGAAAVVIGALIFAAAHIGIDSRDTVLVVARPVASGQIITAEDLRTARISVSSGTASLPASRRNEVIGKTAAVGLVPGGLLAPAQIGGASSLEPGQAIVAVPLKV
ncbi:MAG: SAF domain-containing protein, partial [Actinomycetota bacterium]|nr:SAF domain-containing protein [Actinomycetota bacterium]